jgi:type I restriction enzyme S subunit
MIEQLRAMPKYEVYKESGESWINEIPKHWEIRKLKQVFHEKKHKKNVELNCGSISYGKVVIKDDEKIPYSTKESYQEVLNGEFLINPLNLNYDLISLRIALSYIDVVVSPGYIVLKPHKNINKEYFKYLLHRYDVAYMKLLGSGVRQTINFNHIANSILLFPPLAEQTAIAAFLDRKTAQIDQAIAIKEKQIALLKERKQILIQNAVTRGITPDVLMRDSGVEWIGEIPAHWRIKKIKFVFNSTGGGTPSKERRDYWNGNIPWVSPKDMKEDFISTTEDYMTEKGLKESTSNLIEAGSLLMVFRSGILQRKIPVAINRVSVTLNQDMKAFTPIHQVKVKYFFYFVKGNECFLRAEWVKQGATVESIDALLLNNGPCLIPPIEEQTAIVTHIETVSAKIDLAISIQQQQIDKLKEYKTTLIDSAVTGKIRVPELIEGSVPELADSLVA